MKKSTINKKSGSKPLTNKTIFLAIGIVIACIILLIGIAARIWHYYHQHLTK